MTCDGKSSLPDRHQAACSVLTPRLCVTQDSRCIVLTQGAVVWAPFGSAYWPAKLIRCSQDSQAPVEVELFGTGLKTEIAAAGLTAFNEGCAARCRQLHSQLGQQVS